MRLTETKMGGYKRKTGEQDNPARRNDLCHTTGGSEIGKNKKQYPRQHRKVKPEGKWGLGRGGAISDGNGPNVQVRALTGSCTTRFQVPQHRHHKNGTEVVWRQKVPQIRKAETEEKGSWGKKGGGNPDLNDRMR